MSTNNEWAARIADLERRIELLEGLRRPTEQFGPPEDAAETANDSGTVSDGGEVTLNGRVVWNIGLVAERILDLPDATGATVLASLGHPARAALVRRLLTGPATVADLQQASGGASTGQLYHHLRTLAAVLVDRRRAGTGYPQPQLCLS